MKRLHSLPRGVALVMVLAFMVLLSGIILAFFVGVSTERSFSKTAADAATTQQLANSAVNVVMAQIVDATKGTNPNDASSIWAWASQPGMIRTFDSTGAPKDFFKLYSSDHMVVSGANFTTSSEVPPTDWNGPANAGLYTDLNSPVLVSDTNGPIVPDATNKPNDKYSAVYPIMDPLAENTSTDPAKPNGVDGFSLTSRPGYSGANPLDATQDPTTSSTANPAPMPVKWLYLLKDGKVVSPTGITNGGVTIPGATAANPVTGRMGFWTDDDTNKVNINTASEGTYWDVPRVFSAEDAGKLNSDTWAGALANATPGMAISQALQKEFQRYPGHPATTSLSPILGNFGLSIPNAITSSNASQFNPYYGIAPRVVPGGSNAGTTLAAPSAVMLSPDQDRLYTSVDELMFAAPSSGSSRVTNPSGTSTTPTVITKGVLEKTRFFLTASSNAPEVTLFNTPRISVWPVWDAAANKHLTAFDELAAFCGSAGGKGYYFKRLNARSNTDDYNQIARNQDLYKYLQALTTRIIPGFGGNFSAKFGADRDQILTLIFDYIRCINLADSEQSTPPDPAKEAVPYAPLFNVTNPSDPRLDPTAPSWLGGDVPDLFPLGAGEVIPIKIGSTMGAGRCLTIAEADLLFYGTHKNAASQTDKFRAMFLVQFASPMQGMAGMRSSLKYTVTGLDQFEVQPTTATPTWVPLGLPAGGTNYVEISDFQTQQGLGIGGIEGPAEGLYALSGHPFDPTGPPWPYDSSTKILAAAGGAVKGNYPFFTANDIFFTPKPGATPTPRTFGFRSNPTRSEQGDVTITVSTQPIPGDPTPSVTVQTIVLNFPNSTFRTPDATTSGVNTYDFNTARLSGTAAAPLTVSGATKNIKGGLTTLVASTDTVVGIQPAGAVGNDPNPANDATAGDYRMIAPLSDVPSPRFRAHNDYINTGGGLTQFAHGLMTAGARGSPLYPSGKVGKLAPVTEYTTGTAGWPSVVNRPYVPSRVANGVTRKDGGPGDWDTGIGNTPDGPYMNKPDEGDTRLICHTSDQTITRYPYFLGSVFSEAPPGAPYFSPNRQVPSALMFGSIPTGVQRLLPWQTLLFNPKPEDTTHPGNASPKDHLIADLFWMPVVEPYAISQPFSTAGKINLNYQILPFTYIKRQTALNAVMKATKFLAIPLTDSTSYKPSVRDHGSQQNTAAPPANANRRRSIDIPETLKAFDTKFANNDIYKSATEICDINLIPPGETAATMAAFWNTNKLTGDNVREKPYVDLYPRLTTKSNTYTVHVCVQSIKQSPPHAAAGVFVDPGSSATGGKDSVLSEYRGSTTIERYIDPNDPSLPDFATLTVSNPLDPKLNIDQYYKFRVISTKRFSP